MKVFYTQRLENIIAEIAPFKSTGHFSTNNAWILNFLFFLLFSFIFNTSFSLFSVIFLRFLLVSFFLQYWWKFSLKLFVLFQIELWILSFNFSSIDYFPDAKYFLRYIWLNMFWSFLYYVTPWRNLVAILVWTLLRFFLF